MSRAPSHAGTWYSSNEESLSLQLDRWLESVPDSAPCIGPLTGDVQMAQFPTPRARVIIAPHAGYSYSGAAAAWAYRAADWSNAKRVFILGPSHHFYLTKCALSACDTYVTPFGELRLDKKTISELAATGKFDQMSLNVDEAEHSIEMHLPYLHKMLLRAFSDYGPRPPIIPVLVGNTSEASEVEYGQIFSKYLADPTSVFIISSDFAHWGSRFRYTYYEPMQGDAIMLKSSSSIPREPAIHESIGKVDMRCVEAIERGEVKGWWEVLSLTGNTVCGRHPIGIVMAAIEAIRIQAGPDGQSLGQFRFVRYERSSDCISAKDSSVSYASGFAVM
ncbi:MAG: hypothetical protein Q9162_001963 [Coniocarpon cinnabarinum]